MDYEITEEGKAVVESGLTVRQAHEIKTGCSPTDICEECGKQMPRGLG